MSEKNKEKLCRLTPAEINNLPGKEVKSKRTRSSKTYSLGNGLYQAVIYPEAVHYRNEKGEWEDIDHTLTQADGSLCDHSGDLSVDLAPGGCVTLRKGEHTLSWQIMGASPVEPFAENAKPDYPRHHENRRIKNKVTYANIFPGVDFVCDLKPDEFKDTLVFKDAAALRPMTFLIHTENLALHQSASGEVVAMCSAEEADGKKTIFQLPAPCVVDDNGYPIPGSACAVLTRIDEHNWCWTCEVDAGFAACATYPIRLDPIVKTDTTSAAMSMAYTSSLNPNKNYPGNGFGIQLTHGNSALGETRAYLRFKDEALPEIDSSYYVTSAMMTMCTAYEGTVTPVFATEVMEDWDEASITFNNAPEVADEPMEYATSQASANRYMQFNITNLVRKWYDGENHGLMLNIQQHGAVYLCAAGSVYNRPYITINYVSLAGLEGYLTQDTISCGRAGTAHIGLFNGNLVLSHQETAMNGNLMPVSISRYYNSCYQAVNPFGVGFGWKLSTQQTLHKETLNSTTYYVYMDGDGTRHHFKQTSGEWKDLSGLDLTLTISGTTATITDKGDNKMVFALPTAEFADNYANVKLIQSASDACGNTANFTHNASRVFTSVTDGAARTTSGTVSGGLLTAITAPGMPAVSYEYTSGNLTKITHADGEVTTYAYNSLNLPTTITNHDGTVMEIEYINHMPYRVRKVTMLANNVAYTGRMYTYGNCCTKVTELYPDTDGEMKEGKSIFYHFNDAGNLVSVNDELGYGCFAGYSDDLPANHPAFVSKMQKAVNNYLENHHFLDSTSTAWVGDLMDGSGECGYSSEMNYMGGRAYRLKKTSSTGRIGVYQTVLLPDAQDRSYTFSCQYKTLNNATAQLRVEWKDSAGVTQYAESPAQASEDRWNRQHVSFTLPANAASSSVTVRIMAAGGAGTVWADAAQLEDGMIPNRYNLLQNGNFYMNSSGTPKHWTAYPGMTASDGVTNQIKEGRPSELTGNVMRIYGKPGVEKGISQEMSCIGNKGDTFVAGGWSFSHCRPRDAQGITWYEMHVYFRPLAEDVGMAAGTYPDYQRLASIQWSEEWSGWQFAAEPIVTPWRYTSVFVHLIYRSNLNEVQFSNIFLHKEEFGNTYAYDGNGNVTSVTNLASLKSGAEYDSFDNLISYHLPGRSETYSLNWGSSTAEKQQHLLRAATTPMGYISKTTYDVDDSTVTSPKGLPVQSSLENSAGSRKIISKVEYTTNKNYISKQTDARGKVVETTTDENKGWVTAVKDPKGQTVNYFHDTLGRVTAVTATADGKTYRNAYTYDGDKLMQVAHNTTGDTSDVAYNFAYDSQNRRTTVKVGTQLLSENVYNTTKGDILHGTLSKSVFGNGGEVRYTYDDFKRVTGIQYDTDSADRYEFEYGANGQLSRVTDNLLGRTTLSEYDVSNRPMRKTTVEGTTNVYLGEVTYDQYSNLASFREQVGSARTVYRTDFTYDKENKPTKLTYGSNSNQVAYAYDDIGRMTTRTATVGGKAYTATYGYTAGGHGTGSTTGLISSIAQTGGNFTYTYDDNGNITRVVQDGVETAYAYDALGQLIRVDDGHENATWVYEYDRGGNILTKKKYALGMTSGTPVESKTFAYGNANWKDQLTAVNGIGITYDAIGNPLNDGT